MVALEESAASPADINAGLGGSDVQDQSCFALHVPDCDAAIRIFRHSVHEIRRELFWSLQDSSDGIGEQGCL